MIPKKWSKTSQNILSKDWSRFHMNIESFQMPPLHFVTRTGLGAFTAILLETYKAGPVHWINSHENTVHVGRKL